MTMTSEDGAAMVAPPGEHRGSLLLSLRWKYRELKSVLEKHNYIYNITCKIWRLILHCWNEIYLTDFLWPKIIPLSIFIFIFIFNPFDASDNKLDIKNDIYMIVKRSCWYEFDKCSSFEYSPKYAFAWLALSGRCEHEWVQNIFVSQKSIALFMIYHTQFPKMTPKHGYQFFSSKQMFS